MKRTIGLGALVGAVLLALSPAAAAHAAPTLTPSLGGMVAADASAPFSFELVDVAWTDALVTIQLAEGTMSVDDSGLALALQPGFSSFTDVPEIAFTGSLADITTALASRLTWTAPAVPAESFLRLSISVVSYVAGLTFNPDNGHYYLATGDMQTWIAARDAAAAMTYNGLTGYLATITSAEENTFIADRSGGDNVWFGATSEDEYVDPLIAEPYGSDAAIRGFWHWGTGPEAGTLFSVGLGSPVTEPGQYASWNPGEPNDSPFERCAVTNWAGSAGLWNDLGCGSILRYVVEFGGIGTETPGLSYDNLDAVAPQLPPAPAEELPATGIDAVLPGTLALLLLLAGVLFARRSRAQH